MNISRLVVMHFSGQDGNGQRLTSGALRSRFDKAREGARVDFQFRDIRAKAATDTERPASTCPEASGTQDPQHDGALHQKQAEGIR